MKNMIFIAAVLFATSAQAEIKVGDSALYEVMTESATFDLLGEVTSIDRTNDVLNLKQVISQHGTTIQQSNEQAKLSEQEENEMIFDACLQMPADLNPRFETLTVIAGTFNTCHLTAKDESGATLNGYFAKDVAFGFVKMTKEDSLDGSDLSMELKSFKKN